MHWESIIQYVCLFFCTSAVILRRLIDSLVADDPQLCKDTIVRWCLDGLDTRILALRPTEPGPQEFDEAEATATPALHEVRSLFTRFLPFFYLILPSMSGRPHRPRTYQTTSGGTSLPRLSPSSSSLLFHADRARHPSDSMHPRDEPHHQRAEDRHRRCPDPRGCPQFNSCSPPASGGSARPPALT